VAPVTVTEIVMVSPIVSLTAIVTVPPATGVMLNVSFCVPLGATMATLVFDD
jgi:hypothetical protein